jgi:hypothetical protein
VALLTIGDQFPTYNLTSVVDIDQANPEDAFVQITDKSYEGKSGAWCFSEPGLLAFLRVMVF